MSSIGPEYLLHLKYPDYSKWATPEGPRRKETTPKYFPELSIPGCRFLNRVATVAHYLGLYLISSAQYSYVPLPVQQIINIAEELVSIKEDGSENRGPEPSYLFKSLAAFTDIRYQQPNEIDPLEIRSLEMVFRPINQPITYDAIIQIQPNTRVIYRDRRFRFLNGCTPAEALRMLSSKGMNPADVNKVVDDYSGNPMFFRIMSGNALLEIAFCEGESHELILEEGHKTIDDAITTHGYGQAKCRMSVAGRNGKSAEMRLPLADFCTMSGLKTQQKIDNWFSNISKELILRAKPKEAKEIFEQHESDETASFAFSANGYRY